MRYIRVRGGQRLRLRTAYVTPARVGVGVRSPPGFVVLVVVVVRQGGPAFLVNAQGEATAEGALPFWCSPATRFLKRSPPE